MVTVTRDPGTDTLLAKLRGGPTDLARLVERVECTGRPFVLVSPRAIVAWERRDPEAWASARQWFVEHGVRLLTVPAGPEASGQLDGAATYPEASGSPCWSLIHTSTGRADGCG